MRSPFATERRHATPHHPLVRDIVVVLVVKLVALAALWFAFFRSPPAPQPSDIERHLTFSESIPLQGRRGGQHD